MNGRAEAEGFRPSATLQRAWGAWDRFWFAPCDPTTLAFVRICTGLMALYVHLTYSWGLLSYVGPNGWVNTGLADFMRQEMPYYTLGWGWDDPVYQFDKGDWMWSVYFHVTDPAWIVFLHLVFLAAMLSFALGFQTRLTGIVTWVGAMSYVQRAPMTVFGLDTMLLIVLAYLQLGPAGATLSLDRWLTKRAARRRGEPEPPVQPSSAANFAIRMVQVHFCIIYFASGTSKLLGSTWWNATAPNYFLLNVSFAPYHLAPYRMFVHWLAEHRWLWEALMSAGVLFPILLEVGLPLLIWDRRLRGALICCAVLFHVQIGLLMGLVTFSLMMLVMLTTFLPPEVVRAAIDRAAVKVEALRRRREAVSAL